MDDGVFSSFFSGPGRLSTSSDMEFAMELQLQEIIHDAAYKPPECPEIHTKEGKASAELRHDTATLCEICQEYRPLGSMVPLTCRHSFCINCMSQHGKVSVQAKRVPIRCPAVGCCSFVNVEEWKLFLDRDTISDALHYLTENTIDDSERFFCPHKDCSLLMVVERGMRRGGDSLATCWGCKRLLCISCGVPWHTGTTCEEFQGTPENEREPNDFKLKQLAEAEKWKRCYSCKHLVERAEGCPHITCRCGAEFCYQCGAAWLDKKPTCQCFPEWQSASL